MGNIKRGKKIPKEVWKDMDETIEQTLEETVKRIERLNRILTVAVIIEALSLVIFL